MILGRSIALNLVATNSIINQKLKLMSNKKDTATSTYFERESLPSFLTQERFDQLESELQDYVVFSSRMQYFLQSKIDINNVESVINQLKYQMEVAYQSMVYTDTVANEKRKDYSVAMETLETGILTADLILEVKQNYNRDFMKLRVAEWRK